jgi:hypothetical protein
MRQPSPELLDLFYRSGAFPIDDLDVRDFVQHTSSVYASTWFVPTRTIPAVFFVMGGGSGDLSALIHELRRLAEVTEATAAALSLPLERRSGKQALCYHYFVQVTHIDSRVYAKSVEEWDDALTPLLHASTLHPWFRPFDGYAETYRVGYIMASSLPAVDFDLVAQAEYLGDPDAPVAKRASRGVLNATGMDGYETHNADDGSDDLGSDDRGVANRYERPDFFEEDYAGIDKAGLTAVSQIRLSREDKKFLKIDVRDDL